MPPGAVCLSGHPSADSCNLADTPIFKSLNLPPFMLHWFHGEDTGLQNKLHARIMCVRMRACSMCRSRASCPPPRAFPALNMGTVLFAMGGYGTFLGWYMRSNPSEKMALAPGPALGKSAVSNYWGALGNGLSLCVSCALQCVSCALQALSAKMGRQHDCTIDVLPACPLLLPSQSDMHSTLMTAMGVIFFLGANGGLVLSLVQVCTCAQAQTRGIARERERAHT